MDKKALFVAIEAPIICTIILLLSLFVFGDDIVAKRIGLLLEIFVVFVQLYLFRRA